MTQSTSLDDLPVPENAISSQETGEKKQGKTALQFHHSRGKILILDNNFIKEN